MTNHKLGILAVYWGGGRGGGGGGGGCNPIKPKTTANFKFGTVFSSFFFGFFGFLVFPFWPILTGLTGSVLVVLAGYNSFYKTFAGLHRHYVCYQAILGLSRPHCSHDF